jgi:hypothetical protein
MRTNEQEPKAEEREWNGSVDEIRYTRMGKKRMGMRTERYSCAPTLTLASLRGGAGGSYSHMCQRERGAACR